MFPDSDQVPPIPKSLAVAVKPKSGFFAPSEHIVGHFASLFSSPLLLPDQITQRFKETPLPFTPLLQTPEFDSRIFVYEKELVSRGTPARVNMLVENMLKENQSLAAAPFGPFAQLVHYYKSGTLTIDQAFLLANRMAEFSAHHLVHLTVYGVLLYRFGC